LNWEEEEMQTRYGVRIPPEYLNMVGSVDPNCPPSQHTCVGCGTPIHCSEPHLPGFISSARFKVSFFYYPGNFFSMSEKGVTDVSVTPSSDFW